MSNSKQFRDHGRRLVDRVVRAAFASLTDDPPARRAFADLLLAVRSRSRLLSPTRHPTRLEPAVWALRNLARYRGEFRRSMQTWVGGDGDERHLIHSLASHLLARYPIAAVFGSVWFGDQSTAARRRRRWFISHGRGQRFRDVRGLPVPLTRRMERILIGSPPHLSLAAAIRRAELLALDADDDLVDAVLDTKLGEDLEHGSFWRGAMHLFVNHWAELGAEKVRAIVEFIDAVRFSSQEIMTPEGMLVVPPPEPNFSLTGRTPRSLMRLVARWQAKQISGASGGQTWAGSGLRGLLFHEPETGVRWWLVELCSGVQLQQEGWALRHCVSMYRYKCMGGRASIWSLRRQAGDQPPLSRCTIEVDPHTGRIVQLRGYCNRWVRPPMRRIVEQWAEREGLVFGRYA